MLSCTFVPFSIYTASFPLSCLSDYFLCGICALLSLILVHYITANQLPFYLPKGKLLVNGICYVLVMNLIFFLSGNMQIACVLGSLLTLILATADNYVFRFKGTELLVTDFLAIQTAAAVAGGYRFRPPRNVVIAWVVWFCYCVLNGMIRIYHQYSFFSIHIVSLSVELILLVCFLTATKGVKGSRWSNEGSTKYGYLLSFFLSFRDLVGIKPKGYQPVKIDALADDILTASREDPKQSAKHPDIIVIMNESFADLEVLGKKPDTNIPVTPVFDSLKGKCHQGICPYLCLWRPHGKFRI